MQTKEELEVHYSTEDPWKYTTTAADLSRKVRIINSCAAAKGSLYNRALDLACGEGWITKDLPAREIDGYEISDRARLRFHPDITPRSPLNHPVGLYDLVVCTGALYEFYDWRHLIRLMERHSCGIIVTAGVLGWITPQIYESIAKFADVISTETFEYKRPDLLETQQELKVWQALEADDGC